MTPWSKTNLSFRVENLCKTEAIFKNIQISGALIDMLALYPSVTSIFIS